MVRGFVLERGKEEVWRVGLGEVWMFSRGLWLGGLQL